MKTKTLILALCVSIVCGFNNANGQDGKSLFQVNCAACHHQTKSLVGPPLQGVRSKWAEGSSTEGLIYIWVNDYEEAAAIDPFAAKMTDLKPSNMNKFNLSKDEIDAILDYADIPPETDPGNKTATIAGVSPDEPTGPNYTRNLNVFIILAIVAAILLIYILTMVHTIKMYVTSDYFRKKIKESGGKIVKTLLVLIGLTCIPEAASAATQSSDETFFLIEKSDLWILLTIDLVLFGAALYTNYLFRQLVSIHTKPVHLKFFKKRRKKAIRNIFNNAVPVQEETDILMDHEYDGIRELDNRLPPWWLYMFYLTIVFAVVYLFHYHVLRTGDLQTESYNKEMAQAKLEVDAYLKEMALNVDENNVVFLNDVPSLEEGKAIFTAKCQICHGDKGQGGNGANLSDHYWIYGNRINDIFRTIKYGGKNGMQSWQKDLDPVEIQKVASYVASFKEVITEENGGKFAEGDYYNERIAAVDSAATATEE